VPVVPDRITPGSDALGPRTTRRLFASGVDAPRARRVVDGLVGGVAFVALVIVVAVGSPPSGFERTVVVLVDGTPIWSAGAGEVYLGALFVATLVLAVLALLRRHVALVRDMAIAGLLALAVAALIDAHVPGEWTSPRVACLCAAILAAGPGLVAPYRRAGQWLVAGLAPVSAFVGDATPSGSLAAPLAAVSVVALVRLVFGSPQGRLSLAEVRDALASVAVATRSLAFAERQPAGLLSVVGEDDGGKPITVTVYGRDAVDSQTFSVAWRQVWYRAPGTSPSVRRLSQAEHEALATLMARQAGVRTDRVRVVGSTPNEDVLLVLETDPDDADGVVGADEAGVRAVWSSVRSLHGARIAHTSLDTSHLHLRGGEVAISGFRGSSVAPTEDQLRSDEAQVIVTTALTAGVDTAVTVAKDELGADGLAASLPFLQPTVLTFEQRRQLKHAGMTADDIRNRAAAAAGIKAPELEQLRRVTLGSVLQTVLLVLAFLAVAKSLIGINVHDLADQIGNAVWWFVAAGFVIAQLPRLGACVATIGASPKPLPLGALYALKLAESYVGLAVPSNAAKLSMDVRFLQRQGLPPGSTVAIGAVESVVQMLVRITLLVGLIALTPISLDPHLKAPDAGSVGRGVLIVVIVLAVAVITVALRPAWRTQATARIREWYAQATDALRGLNSPRRLGLILVGDLAQELLSAVALGAFTASLGYPLGLPELLFVKVSVSLLSGLVPVPGGIGVVEGGLTYGLVQAGIPDLTAFAAAVLYRLAVFYIPPTWGFFALRWLQRRGDL
jgi:uncharacterized membrane protein YbhN (UPF0104 family)